MFHSKIEIIYSGKVDLENLELSEHDRRILERLQLKRARDAAAEELVSFKIKKFWICNINHKLYTNLGSCSEFGLERRK